MHLKIQVTILKSVVGLWGFFIFFPTIKVTNRTYFSKCYIYNQKKKEKVTQIILTNYGKTFETANRNESNTLCRQKKKKKKKKKKKNII
jgi:DNA-binding cell septation regulator SpoVG